MNLTAKIKAPAATATILAMSPAPSGAPDAAGAPFLADLLAQVRGLAAACARAERQILAASARNEEAQIPRAEQIQEHVARHFGFTVEQIRARIPRTRNICTARQFASWYIRRFTKLSWSEIGLLMNRADHGTPLHNCKRARQILDTEPKMRAFLVPLEKEFAVEAQDIEH